MRNRSHDHYLSQPAEPLLSTHLEHLIFADSLSLQCRTTSSFGDVELKREAVSLESQACRLLKGSSSGLLSKCCRVIRELSGTGPDLAATRPPLLGHAGRNRGIKSRGAVIATILSVKGHSRPVNCVKTRIWRRAR